MKWQADGMPYTPRQEGTGKANKYDTIAVYQWLVKKALTDAGRGGLFEDEKERLTKEQADGAAMKNDILRGNLIDLEGAKLVAAQAAAVIRQKIMSSSMPDREKQALLADIYALAETDFQKPDADEEEDEQPAKPSKPSGR